MSLTRPTLFAEGRTDWYSRRWHRRALLAPAFAIRALATLLALCLGCGEEEAGPGGGKGIAIHYSYGGPVGQAREPVWMDLTWYKTDGGGTKLFLGDQFYDKIDNYYTEIVRYWGMVSLFLPGATLPLFAVLGTPSGQESCFVDIYEARDETHPILGGPDAGIKPYGTDKPFGRLRRTARYPRTGTLEQAGKMRHILTPSGAYLTFTKDQTVEIWRLPVAELAAGGAPQPEVILPPTDFRARWDSEATGFATAVEWVRISDSGVVYISEKADEAGQEHRRIWRLKKGGSLEVVLSPQQWLTMRSPSKQAQTAQMHSFDVVGETPFFSAAVQEFSYQARQDQIDNPRRDHRIEFMRLGK